MTNLSSKKGKGSIYGENFDRLTFKNSNITLEDINLCNLIANISNEFARCIYYLFVALLLAAVIITYVYKKDLFQR